MTAKSDFLRDLLRPEKLTTIVDIGANPIDGDPPYKQMLERELCQVIGFEPQKEVSLMPLYENQPMFCEIDRELRMQGFVPHAFADVYLKDYSFSFEIK